MIHTYLPRNCVVFLLLCELTRSAIYGSQKFDSHKWPTVLVDEVKGKPCNLEACLCGSLYSTFTTSFYPYAFYNKRLQMLFKDQLDRSKATCSFKVFGPTRTCIQDHNMVVEILIQNHVSWRMGITKVSSFVQSCVSRKLSVKVWLEISAIQKSL